jgi:hypothetical protein
VNTFCPGLKGRFHQVLEIVFLLIVALPSVVRAQNSTNSAVGKWNARLVTAQPSLPQPTNTAANVLLTFGFPSSRAEVASTVAKVSLEVSNEAISVKLENGVPLEIPPSQVAATGYDNSSHSKGWAWLGPAESPELSYGEGSVLIIVPLLVGAAISAPFKTTEHYVRVFWNGAEGPDEILLELGKNDYADVLAQLQRVTGKPWHDLPKEREELRHELEQAKSDKKSVNLDRPVFVNGAELKSGEYQLLLLERTANAGEVYFFRGASVKVNEIAAQAVVEIDKENHSTGPVAPDYGSEAGVATITALAMPEETLRFTSAPRPAKVEHAARSFYAGSNEWAIVTRTDYEGESAFRFTVLHARFGPPCTGYLYVTRQRIVFSRAPLSDSHCDTFTVARTDVQAKALAGKRTNRFLEVRLKDKNYTFQPVFEKKGGKRMARLGKSRNAAREFAEFFVRTVTDFDAVDRETQPVAPPVSQPNN